ncbi:MAG: hypothetical protein AAF394_02075 [Planctomycetota bacterium]
MPSTKADTLWWFSTGGGHSVVDHYNSDGDLIGTHLYGPGNEYIGTIWYNEDGSWDFSNPNPGDDSGGGGVSDDQLQLLTEMAKQMGAEGYEQDSFWMQLLMLGILPDNLGPTLIDPFDGGVLANDYEGLGGFGGGYDPNVPWNEQIKTGSGRDDDDDDNGSRNSGAAPIDPGSFGEYYGLSPELVNPVPGLWR